MVPVQKKKEKRRLYEPPYTFEPLAHLVKDLLGSCFATLTDRGAHPAIFGATVVALCSFLVNVGRAIGHELVISRSCRLAKWGAVAATSLTSLEKTHLHL